MYIYILIYIYKDHFKNIPAPISYECVALCLNQASFCLAQLFHQCSANVGVHIVNKNPVWLNTRTILNKKYEHMKRTNLLELRQL